MGDALGIAQPQRVNFGQMLSGRYFVIPHYQRHYAWTKKQCQELFEDCVLTARNPGRERFMSTITTIAPAGNVNYPTHTDQGYAQLRPLLVVDGQQRLTSILILISCICRKLLSDNQADTAARNAYANFVSTPLLDGRLFLRVVPQPIPSHPELMQQFFQNLVALDDPGEGRDFEILIPAQRRLKQARETFEEGIRHLADLPSEDRVPLEDLLTCVASRLIFILNTLADVGQAGEVFEGLNNRGLGLSALENLKAFAIYAVQSFRRADRLPAPMQDTPSDLNDAFNNAIGQIYHRLDRVGLPDNTAADLLCAFWPLVISRVEQAELSKDGQQPLPPDRARPVDAIRSNLHIQRARSEEQQATLLQTMDFMICDRLVPASEYFSDARRPLHRQSFQNINLFGEEKKELTGLHQRLVEMQCSVPFLPIMIAHRAMQPNQADDYLKLLRLIERVAFWVYEIGERNRGAGQGNLTQLSRKFVDGVINFDELLLALRVFALSSGRATAGEDDYGEDELQNRIETAMQVFRPGVWAAFAFEWLLTKTINLPAYGKFVRLVRENRYLRLVPDGRGRLPAGYELTRADMNHPGNIAITEGMPNWTAGQCVDFNALPYVEKRENLIELGYNVELPRNALTRAWATRQLTNIKTLAIARWAIPEDGRICEATWGIAPPQQPDDPPEDED